MGSYRVRLFRTQRLKQKFHLRIESGVTPFKTLFWSEKYVNHGYARMLGQNIAEALGATFIDETG